ncbi:MAG: PIG-L family deacetylase [Verrucomicrobiae bacterium]|nr:PIG-L family deacetylase [Verrucomicrobiae bacterium]
MTRTFVPRTAILIGILFTAPANAQTEPVTGANLLKTDILAVLAHPDDETMLAATVARYALVEKKNIAHVYCTRGEGGGNMVGTQWGPALGILRERELRDCLDTLGVRPCYFLDQVDWAYTESASMTLEKWDREAAVERLTRLIRTLRPEIILTMSPFPSPGWHGHHQAAGMLAVEATAAAADPQQFPLQINREGLAAWRTPKLYYRGSKNDDQPTSEAAINTRFLLPDGKSLQDTVREALSNHRSQGFGRFSRGGSLMPPETFVRLRSTVDNGPAEDDLFAGLKNAGTEWITPPQEPKSKAPALSFEPRPAVTQFLDWAKTNSIDHLAGALKSDIPAVCRLTTELHLNVINAKPGTIRFDASIPGVSIPKPISFNETQSHLVIPVTVQTTDRDVEIDAWLYQGDPFFPVAGTKITLHPVPLTSAPRVEALTIDQPAGWASLPELPISPSQLVQGKVESPQDCSATFRIAHDDQFFYTEVTVTDDTIVSNIAPNDIRGHWRSDSVEICIDPGGSEHTLTCFKLGIFPFDSTGKVRAARDADANQGPVEETSPGTRLFSEQLADGTGYRIRAAIPLADTRIQISELPVNIGFNIIIYDGDKSDASPGENINQARIAWSPRPGIQGRPEDWGRVTLER